MDGLLRHENALTAPATEPFDAAAENGDAGTRNLAPDSYALDASAMETPVPYEQTAYRDALPPEIAVERLAQPGPPRLNVIVPHLYREHAFGGVLSALELGGELAGGYPEVRFVSMAETPPEEQRIDLAGLVRGEARNNVSIASTANAQPLSCHARDILFCTYWPSVSAWRRQAALMEQAGLAPNPFYYFIQDWEPGFYPLGAKYMAAESTYGHGNFCFAIFNSRELARFFQHRKYLLPKAAVIAPSLNPVLHNVLKAWGFTLPPKPTENVSILVYGRPRQPRNCFPVILEGLARWLKEAPPQERRNLRLLSAGVAHESIELAPGAVLRSLGKLSLPDYAAALAQSHVGVSLMASPHPSYPPLEMAAFGLEVVTNNFPGKDLSQSHPRIRSIPAPEPDALARAVGQAVASARARAGRPERAQLPDAMSPDPWKANIQKARIPRLSPTS